MQKHMNRWRLGATGVLTVLLVVACSVSAATRSQADEAADNSDTASITSVGPFGGNLWDVAIDPTSGTVYTVAKDTPNGFFKSTNGGELWTGITGYDLGGSTAIEINPEDGAVFVVFNRGTYRTTDGGTTMEQIIEDGSQAFLFAQDTLMMGSNQQPGTVNISTDEGDTFTNATVTEDTTIDLWWLADGITEGVFYAVGYDDDQGIHAYKTVDSGATWEALDMPEGMPASGSARIAVNPLDPTIVAMTAGYSENGYISTDSGATWTELEEGSESCVYDQEGRLYFGEQYSEDNGTTWNSLGQDEATGSALGGHNLTVDPNDVNVIYVDGMPGMEKSTDRGETWTQVNEGITGITIPDISQATDKNIVWAAGYNGIGKTENFLDENPTWQFPLLLDPGKSIWTQPDNPDVAVVGLLGAIKRTTDGGATWSENVAEDVLDHSLAVGDIIADVSDPNTLYAAVMTNEPNELKVGTVLISTDLGETWTDMELSDDASAQALSQASDGTLYVGVGGTGGDVNQTGIYTYNGSEWSKLTGAPEEEIIKISVDPSDDNTIYAVASQPYGNNNTGLFGFYKSEDAGATWTESTEGISENDTEYNSLAIQSSTNPTTLYLGAINSDGQGILYKSSDGGDTWGVLYTGLKDETYYTMIFDGVTTGSTRGLFTINSKAKVRVHKKAAESTPHRKRITLTLKDSVTNKILKHKHVKIMRKVHGEYERVKTVETNKHGKVTFTIKVRSGKTARVKAVWVPKNNAADEYTRSVSRVLTLRSE
jgi:photosystem II stability/assembly factor-like uncharacterized protein